jgi:hypothetical protein
MSAGGEAGGHAGTVRGVAVLTRLARAFQPRDRWAQAGQDAEIHPIEAQIEAARG